MNLRVPVIDTEGQIPFIPTKTGPSSMKMCNETITVFNAKHDPEHDRDDYFGTVIAGVSWYCSIVSAVDGSGLRAANQFTIRVPYDADFGGKTYLSPTEYAKAEDVSDKFTFGNGDIIVKGIVEDAGLRPAELHRRFDALTILGVTDNRRAPNAPHWKVVGK